MSLKETERGGQKGEKTLRKTALKAKVFHSGRQEEQRSTWPNDTKRSSKISRSN